jgi:hypothetical protein
MQQSKRKSGSSVRAPENARRQVTCLAAFLVMASLAEEGLAGVARMGNPTSSGEQVFRVGRLAPTREG